jgi:hypothetical protein
MANWADLVELRLRIKDPLGVIAILSVADEATRLAVTAPARQTAYLQADTGVYYTWDEGLKEWEARDLLLSDTRIGVLIDLYGLAKAAPKAVKDIIPELGHRLAYIARTQDGANSTDFVNLSTMHNFYKDLAKSMEEEVAKDEGASTGRMFRTRDPSIGGGMRG